MPDGSFTLSLSLIFVRRYNYNLMRLRVEKSFFVMRCHHRPGEECIDVI